MKTLTRGIILAFALAATPQIAELHVFAQNMSGPDYVASAPAGWSVAVDEYGNNVLTPPNAGMEIYMVGTLDQKTNSTATSDVQAEVDELMKVLFPNPALISDANESSEWRVLVYEMANPQGQPFRGVFTLVRIETTVVVAISVAPPEVLAMRADEIGAMVETISARNTDTPPDSSPTATQGNEGSTVAKPPRGNRLESVFLPIDQPTIEDADPLVGRWIMKQSEASSDIMTIETTTTLTFDGGRYTMNIATTSVAGGILEQTNGTETQTYSGTYRVEGSTFFATPENGPETRFDYRFVNAADGTQVLRLQMGDEVLHFYPG
ncbi:MAG: hypothetical protein AAF456_18355 [Planctomycetota bacterium]